MRLTFLGTSAGVPTPDRNVTAQAVQFDHGPIWLLDCGEATQHQLMRAGLKAAKVERILITHLHGDHILGLPGMLAAIAISGRGEPVQVCGPPGLRELVATVLRLTGAEPGYLLDLVEIAPETIALAEPAPVFFSALPDRRRWSACPIPIRHRVPCLAWLLREPPRPGIFHPDRADRLGIPPGPLRRRLQLGEPATLPDGRTVQPSEVGDPSRPGRRVLLLGDTDDADACLAAAHGCDLAVREATYATGLEGKARQWGHSTAGMTGAWAAKLACRTLILTHFSARYTLPGESGGVDVGALVDQARHEAPGIEVLAAGDLWTWRLP